MWVNLDLFYGTHNDLLVQTKMYQDILDLYVYIFIGTHLNQLDLVGQLESIQVFLKSAGLTWTHMKVTGTLF